MAEEITKLWEYLPFPHEYNKLRIDTKELNFFRVKDRWLNQRFKGLKSEIDRILTINKTYDPEIKKVKCSRYVPSLAKIPIENRRPLNEWLFQYRSLLHESQPVI